MRLKGWKEIPIGGMISEPGSSVEFDVSQWRTFRPVLDKKKCTRCGLCWIYCPEGAIKINDDGSYEVNLSYCKGCGICHRICAVKAMSMVKEG
ncbi:MAG: 4Fe-4S binding protein [Candidatus Methanomethylicaceae archaeon]